MMKTSSGKLVVLLLYGFLYGCISEQEKDIESRNTRSVSGRCNFNSPSGIPVQNAQQTRLNIRPNKDGTKYNYNEVLHKSLLFYDAQRSGYLPSNNKIPWRGDSGLKDGCDIGIDATGGWYNAGDFVKFNFPMAFTLTMLSWGGELFRSAYEDAGEIQNMIDTVQWGTEYFIKCHTSKYELVGQVGHVQTDHENWGRPEELTTMRPTYKISARDPGTELAAETAAALAASSIFLKKSNPTLSSAALTHAKELFEFADKYRGNYHDAIPDVSSHYKSYSGYEDELIWGSVWLYKATSETKYLTKAETQYNQTKDLFSSEHYFSWDTKFIGAQALLAEITRNSQYMTAFTLFLDSLSVAPATRKGLYYISDSGPNRYAGNAAFLSLFGATFDPPLTKKDSYMKWAEKQIGILLGDSGRSYLIGFGDNYPTRAHHRSSSCPPYPQKCDWSTYHLSTANHYILYGGLVGGPDKNDAFNDNRDEHQQNQVSCNFNAGFQSAVAGLKYIAMKQRQPASSPRRKPVSPPTISTTADTDTLTTLQTTTRPITASPLERRRCRTTATNGTPVIQAKQTSPKFKSNNDGTKYNYNEVLHKSIMFYEAQRAGELPRNNRITWRGNSVLKDGCDVGVDLSGGWFDGGNYIKFGLPMAFSLTTLAWGGIMFRDAYDDAGELQNFIESIKWPTEYLIKAHISKYEFIGQIGDPKSDHSNWGRPEELKMSRPSYKITSDNPGTEVVAESAAALAASSIFLRQTDIALAAKAIKHAIELYEFADKYRGSYDSAIPGVDEFYASHSGYNDELIWGAIWLYKATKNKKYLTKAENLYNETKKEFANEVSFSWDTKFIAAQALLAEITEKDIYRQPLSQFYYTLKETKTTPEGMYHSNDWSANRYTGGATLIAIIGATLKPPLATKDLYATWAENQINLLLGDSGISYMVGFGNNYPLMVHHRASSCPSYPEECGWSTYHSLTGNPYILYGALVGGPSSDGTYKDDREAYEGSQVGCDFNAGFQSTVAGLKHLSMMKKKGLWTASKVSLPTPKPTVKQRVRVVNRFRCRARSKTGSPKYGAIQTPINFKQNTDGTKYNYNELLHKSLLFYEAQRSGRLPTNNRIPWRGNSAMKDGCDIGADASGGWYDGGDHMKFNFPMAFSLTTLSWGGILYRDAYKNSGEYQNMIKCIEWGTDYFIRSHISKFELVAQVGKVKDDHDYWGRPEQLKMSRPTYKITKNNPGTELAAEVAAALAASSIFLNESDKSLSNEALEHAKELFEFAETYRGSYHKVVPVEFYISFSGYEDELIWAAIWLHKATGSQSYLNKAIEWYDEVKNKTKIEYSWDYKLIGVQALLADITKEDKYRAEFSQFLDGLFNSSTTPQGLYHTNDWAPNRYTGGAAFMALLGSTMQPPLPRANSYFKWAEKQIGLLVGDDTMSYVIGFGSKYPTLPHHRSSSCPPHPKICDWTTYHSVKKNHYILYGALVGGPDADGVYWDNRDAYAGSQIGLDYNAAFQSAVAGLKDAAMKNKGKAVDDIVTDIITPTTYSVSEKNFAFQIFQPKPTLQRTTPVPTTRSLSEKKRCLSSSPSGSPVFQAKQTQPRFKPKNDDTKHNYNEVLHKSILFFEAQRSGKLPSNNRIPWRGDSAMKDGCDTGIDLTGGWYDAGDMVKFGFPMAFSLTTLAWGGIVFRDAYKDAGEYHHMINSIKWTTEYLIKSHISKYELVAQVGHGKTDHDSWGRPETMTMRRPVYKITAAKPGTELAAETAAALAASSIFLDETHPTLAAEALAHAKELYEFADKYRGLYHEAVPDASEYYKSISGYDDELIWGAAWLYRATKDDFYLKNASYNYNRIGGSYHSEMRFTWDRKLTGAQALLAELTGATKYRKPLIKYLNTLMTSETTPQGLYFHSQWGPNRHTAGAALIATVAATLKPALPKKDVYLKWAQKQIGILLGDSGRSYVIGYGSNYPHSPHHRAGSCPPYPQRCDWSTYNSPRKNHYILYGALVGGPDKGGYFQDRRNVFEQSEVACDYNALFQSAVAGLKYFAMKERPEPKTTTTTMTTLKTTTTASTTTLPKTATATTKRKPKFVRRVKCRPKNSKRCINARKRAAQKRG